MLKYIRVTVPYYIPVAITGAFLGIATSGGILNSNALLCFLSLAFLVGGFNTFNGVTDFKIDLVNKPHRPIPKGEISRKNALIYTGILYLLSIIIAYYLTPEFFQIILISIIITALYSLPIIRLRKRFLIGNLCGATFYGLLCPLAGWSLISTNPIPIYIIGFTFLLALGLSITKDLEDIIGDRIYAIKTMPVQLGIKASAWLTSVILLITFGYFLYTISVGLIVKEFSIILIILPAFFFLIRELYKTKDNYSIDKRIARNIFYLLISLGILTEFLIGAIALMI